jgi:hypothetical protein
MRQFLVIAVILSLSSGLLAQSFSIRGKLVNDKSEPLVGANVLLNHPWGELVSGAVTGADGEFAIERIGRGGYQMVASYLGYDDLKREITLTDKSINLGAITMAASAVDLGEVKITGQAVPAIQKGDTTEFSVKSFKTMKDATAEELVGKMPTVTVEQGKVQAQGETVKQILVDGKPFFGNDPTTALKNLPAEVIDRIQVFDQMSEQSQFTRIDDGNASKTINIITKPNMRTGQFGKLFAGYGTDDRYLAGGNINVFKKDMRLSFIGMTNNVNMQNFAVEDLLGAIGSSGGSSRMFMMGGGGRPGGFSGGGGFRPDGGISDFLVQPQGGITQTHAIGLNYADKWGTKFDLSGSYFFNKTKNSSVETLLRQFVDEANPQIYNQENNASANNYNHRFNFRMEYTIDSFNSFIIRPRLSLQTNEGNSENVGATSLLGSAVNATNNLFSSDYETVNFSGSLLYRLRFKTDRRTFSIDVNPGYAPKNGRSALLSENVFYSGQRLSDTLDQNATLDVGSWNVSANLTYTEPISPKSTLSFNYRPSYQQEESDKYTFDFNPLTGLYDSQNNLLSNVFSNDYITHQAGLSYNFAKDKDLNINVRATAQWANLLNDQVFPDAREFQQTFFDLLPFVMIRYNLTQQKSFRLYYRSNTQLPSVEQLQNVVNNSNPLQLTVGNPNLVQAAQHNMFFRYQANNTDKATVFFGFFNAGFTLNNISKATYLPNSDNPIFAQYNVGKGAQLTQPVNLDGQWNVRSFITYGFPIKPIKSNLNLDVSGSFSRIPGLLNDALNYSDNSSAGVGMSLGSNISDKLDFTLASRSSFNNVTNTLQTSSNTQFFSQNSSLRFNWIIFKGFILRTDVNHQLYTGLSEDFNQNYWLWNLGIGKKLFKNELGEITLAVNDLLNQNVNIRRNVTEVYFEDIQTNALQQYFMLSFTYNLRHFRLK